MRVVSILAVTLAAIMPALAFAQTEAKKQVPRVSGEVAAVDASARKLTVKADNGTPATVHIADQARIVRVPEGEKDPKKFIAITVGGISVGDRVLARGPLEPDGATLSAAVVYVLSKGDVAQQHQQERVEWQKRGVSGSIVGLDPASKEITISVRTREGLKPLLVDVSGNTSYRRYAPDSVRSSDAKVSAWDELNLGDEVHILGDKSEDGAHLRAEQIYSGAFQTIAATVVSVDAASNTIQVAQLPGKQAIVVRTTPDTMLRRLPAQMATMMAMRMHGGAAGGQGGAPGSQSRGGAPAHEDASRAGSQPPDARGNGNFDLRQLLERMPPVTLAELKPGDALILSSSKGSNPANITAIRVVAGVEPFLAAAPRGNSGQVNLGEWSMDMSAPGE